MPKSKTKRRWTAKSVWIHLVCMIYNWYSDNICSSFFKRLAGKSFFAERSPMEIFCLNRFVSASHGWQFLGSVVQFFLVQTEHEGFFVSWRELKIIQTKPTEKKPTENGHCKPADFRQILQFICLFYPTFGYPYWLPYSINIIQLNANTTKCAIRYLLWGNFSWLVSLALIKQKKPGNWFQANVTWLWSSPVIKLTDYSSARGWLLSAYQ